MAGSSDSEILGKIKGHSVFKVKFEDISYPIYILGIQEGDKLQLKSLSDHPFEINSKDIVIDKDIQTTIRGLIFTYNSNFISAISKQQPEVLTNFLRDMSDIQLSDEKYDLKSMGRWLGLFNILNSPKPGAKLSNEPIIVFTQDHFNKFNDLEKSKYIQGTIDDITESLKYAS